MGNLHLTAVLFDWDLTLAHTLGDATHAERLTALFNRQGVNCTLADITAALDQYHKKITQVPLPSGIHNPPQTQADIVYQYRQLLIYMGQPLRQTDFLNNLYDSYSILPLALYPDTRPLLTQLHADGYALGVITNHSSHIRPVIDHHIGDIIPTEQVTISQDLDSYKPDPLIFRHAVAQIGQAATNCLFVGDNLWVDAVGAVTEGGFAHGVWLDRKQTEAMAILPEQTSRITTLAQLPDLLAAL